MPRRPKRKLVCQLPQVTGLDPTGTSGSREPIYLTVDEYETIRLVDYEGLSQEECGERMHVARATIQKVYEAAREKLAVTLVEGRPLRIGGGAYELCDGTNPACDPEDCPLRG